METPADTLKRRFDAAATALRNGDWLQARHLAMGLIAEMPSHPPLFFICGAAALELRQAPSAIEYLSRAVDLDPANADYLVQLSRALTTVRRYTDASVVAGKAWTLLPREPATLDILGVVFSRLNEHKKAAEVFQRLVDSNPRVASYRFNLATSFIFTGSIEAAEFQLEECLKLDPEFWKAHAALAKLRKQTGDRNHLERLLAILPSAQAPDAATYVHMALAKEFEDLEQYPRAFEHFTSGKAATRAAKRYSISRDEAIFEAIERNFGGMVPSATGHPSSEPIFVFGMPRSGTTLVERILSSHSRVQSTGELENFGFVLKRASGSATSFMPDPDTIVRSRHLDWARLGSDYLASTRPGTGRKPRFVDKLPHNFLYAGYIANALPMAKMVCVRRGPMDTCLGNFRQLFVKAYSYCDYSLDILDTGRYYILFDRLMSYWERLLSGRILTVQYETLVRDQASCTRQLLEFCDLPWEEACLRFKDNTAPVATASALQVREPINSHSIGRWKNYEAQLAPLRQLLEGAGIEIRDPA